MVNLQISMASLRFTFTFASLVLTVIATLDASASYMGANGTAGATVLIDSAIQALGGREALSSLQGVVYEAERQAQVSYFIRIKLGSN
jgi:hypothetical protein